MSKKTVILGTAHGGNVAGKCSPDKSFYEYKYSREIISELKAELECDGYTVLVDIPAAAVPSRQSAELSCRCAIVNNICERYGAGNCIYVSIHVNAAGNGSEWKTAGGWCAYTSKGKTSADALATNLYEAAKESLQDYAKSMESLKKSGSYGSSQQPFRTDYSDKDADLESNFYVLAHTQCAAVLTENLFQDNKCDVAFLTSDKGRRAIVELHKNGIERYFEQCSK